MSVRMLPNFVFLFDLYENRYLWLYLMPTWRFLTFWVQMVVDFGKLCNMAPGPAWDLPALWPPTPRLSAKYVLYRRADDESD